jgi:hypothetical protein
VQICGKRRISHLSVIVICRGAAWRTLNSFITLRSDEQQGPVYAVQQAGCHTPIEHLGQAAPAVAGYRNEVRTFAFGSAYNRFHDRALNDARARLDAFLAELSP